MASKLEHALALAAKGFKVFPIQPGAKKPPLLAGWPKRATSDPETVRQFWIAVPEANIGISCEGFVVIDVDVKKGGNESLEALELIYELPTTLRTNTPSGGRHYFYRLPNGHPGVPNSVSALGLGLDIRSTGGYVVAPGSTTDAGSYTFEHDATLTAETPAWLVERLGAVPVARAEQTAPVPTAPDSAVERARQWIAGQLPAVEGQGGDARTFAVACGLRDLGVSEEQAVELLTAWNATCLPPWSPAELANKARNAYRYAQNEAGSRAALPDDFPLLPEIVGTTALSAQDSGQTTKRPQMQRLADFAASERRGPGYLVKGLLERRSYAELFGAPGEGKTFVALDMAYHVAAGAAWMGRKVHAGTVLYLAYEGTGGLVKRAQALRQKYGHKDVPLYIAPAAFNLRDLTGRKALADLLATLPEKPVFIVIDTFARALMGGDENSAQDVGAFNSAVAALIDSTQACVMIIHHSGKNKSAGARGSSALLGAIDTELEVDNHTVTANKQRDVEACEPIGFKLVPLIVSVDEDGDDITSCVVEPAQAPPAGVNVRLGGNAKRGFEALCTLKPDNAPADPEDWKRLCEPFLGPRVRQGFYDLKKALLKKGVIIEDGSGYITRRME